MSPPGQAFDVLRQFLQRTTIKLRHVTALVLQWTRTRLPPAKIRTELDRQL
ncbi:hypothetical protein ACIRL0_24370 [Streptomyces sp. NPDC102365]|uniref:hypothetical protein n=1 Tax=Streptomyces sp. NPDC102365 TaxID=3366162 RepID=UPI0038010C26